MESHVLLAHVWEMTQPVTHRLNDEPLGEPARNRGPVDLLVEASRLNFTDAEVAELKRLYALKDQPALGKTPQIDP